MIHLHQSRFCLIVFTILSVGGSLVSADDKLQEPSTRESELIAILKSDAPSAEKALACKHLAVHGTVHAVPELAQLLPDEQLNSWARIALEAIPDPAAGDALRDAIDAVDGRPLIGVVNSIGVRRDEESVAALQSQLANENVDVASAAAAALGRIGNKAATTSLRKALVDGAEAIRPAVAEGCILCAEQLQSEGNEIEAIAIFRELRSADIPRVWYLAATRGEILARGQKGIPLLVEQLGSQEKDLFQLALSTAREFPGDEIDKALASQLVDLEPSRAALVVLAMADRPDSVVLAAILGAAVDGPHLVRLAALESLGRVGDESCLSPLLSVATEDNAELSQAAKSSLAELPGKNVDFDIVALLPKSDGAEFRVLLELVGERRIAAIDSLMKALDHSEPATRQAALASLGKTVTAEELPLLVSHVVSPRHDEDAVAAQSALTEAAIRMPEREACALELSAAMENASLPTKGVLLEILGSVGGAKALETMHQAAKSDTEELKDVSTRLLGEWMTVDAAPVLHDLATSGSFDKYQIRAIRGFIRIARQFNMPPAQRAELCRQALAAAKRTDEKLLVFDVLERYPTRQMLEVAVEVMNDPGLNDRASQSVMSIASQLTSKDANIEDLLTKAGFEKVDLQIVKATYGAGENQTDVTELLKKQVGDLPLIPLSERKFNTAFGGDPAPGTPKQLTIEYTINGKPGKATIAEDALILLPVPE